MVVAWFGLHSASSDGGTCLGNCGSRLAVMFFNVLWKLVELLFWRETVAEGGCIFHVDAMKANNRNYLKCYTGDLKNVMNITK
jgi:hypothetical protein